MSLRLLLLSQDPAFFKTLAQQLAPQGFDCADAGPKTDQDFDAVLLDGAQMPDPGQGPVLRLVGPDEETDEECLVKPVRLAQLVSRLRQLAERFRGKRQRRIGDWELDAQTGQLIRGQECQKLTGKEAAILIELFDSESVVGREALLENVWGYGSGISTHTLETHIYRLRQKIEADPGEPQVLLTLDGGYLLKKSS